MSISVRIGRIANIKHLTYRMECCAFLDVEVLSQHIGAVPAARRKVHASLAQRLKQSSTIENRLTSFLCLRAVQPKCSTRIKMRCLCYPKPQFRECNTLQRACSNKSAYACHPIRTSSSHLKKFTPNMAGGDAPDLGPGVRRDAGTRV